MSTEHRSMGNDMQQCIQECLNCHSVCLATVAPRLEMGGAHASPQHIGLLLDCAEICQTSANFMLRGSALHARTCGVCAEVCTRRAEECERMGDDAQMRACAEQCRRRAESCRRMATMAA